jgi:diaminohydroxyphosphoribosylaminopyrimidine deaminase/5-amino-6-(5-phosphoribosylamino)uracil reductase
LTTDEKYIQRCLELAEKGRGQVAPNPMVGSVIVCDGKIIGEGYHEKYGEAHAEVNAINSVKDKKLLAKSTIYVNLEPCSHYGKTPPCALKIIENKIPRVVIGNQDPFPKVQGGGIKMLKDNGVEVTVDVLQKKSAELNKRFFTFHEKRRPYIILKWAESADGFIDKQRENSEEKPVKISNAKTSQQNHKLRTEESAIMVATRTALFDNPKLVARLAEGRNPVRIVIDRSLKIPKSFNLFDGKAKTIIFTEKNEAASSDSVQYVKIDFQKNILPQILDELYRQNLISVIVEGGAELLNSFIKANLWDEARIETNPALRLENGVKAPNFDRKNFISEEILDNNYVRYYKNY